MTAQSLRSLKPNRDIEKINQSYVSHLYNAGGRNVNSFYDQHKERLDGFWEYNRSDTKAKRLFTEKHKEKGGKRFSLSMSPIYFLIQNRSNCYLIEDNINNEDLMADDFPDISISTIPFDIWHSTRKQVKTDKKRYLFQKSEHAMFKGFCSVLHNNELNPVQMTEVEENVYTAEWISFISVKKHKSGSVSVALKIEQLKMFTAEGAISFEREIIKSYKLEYLINNTVELSVKGKDKSDLNDLLEMTGYLNRQILFVKNYSINGDYIYFNDAIAPIYEFLLVERNSFSPFDDYSIHDRLKERCKGLWQNPNLKDLPYAELVLLRLFVDKQFDNEPNYRNLRCKQTEMRKSIQEYLDKGDSKGAAIQSISMQNYKYSNALVKVLLKAPLFSIQSSVLKSLYEAEDIIGIDNTRRFITLPNEKDIDWSLINNRTLMNALAMNFSLHQVKQYRNNMIDMNLSASERKHYGKLFSELTKKTSDMIGMYFFLKRREVDFTIPSRNINEAHNFLVPIANIQRQRQRDETNEERRLLRQAFDNESTSDRFEDFVFSNFTIRPPKTASELIDVGHTLQHCVGMYVESFYNKKMLIALLVDDVTNEYLACLEITNNQIIVQAKSKYNRPIKENQLMSDIVQAFADDRKLSIGTIDIDTSHT